MPASEPTPTAVDTGFYRNLPALAVFEQALDTDTHVDVPDDWWVVVADVENSTAAIRAGAYKDVNTVGVATIAALVNVDRNIELPFIFGGDGAQLAIPGVLKERAIVALRGAQQMAEREFGLRLRVGLVSVASLRAVDCRVRLNKLALSPLVDLPVFSGGGWQEAERRVKAGDVAQALIVQPDEGLAEASFAGFECRWQNIPAFHGGKLALIVVATDQDSAVNRATYRRVIERVGEIAGDPADCHPLLADRLQLSFSPFVLYREARLRAVNPGWLARMRDLLRIFLGNLAGAWLFARRIDTRQVRWSRYRAEMVANTDFRKFDGALRMVLDLGEAPMAELETWLAGEFAQGRLAWGAHRSQQALITCLVESHAGRHVHFVDGSDGGYALAAEQLKERLGELARRA